MEGRSAGRPLVRLRILALAPFVGLATVALALVAASLSPVGTSVEGLSAELSPNSPVTLTLPRVGVSIVEAELFETTRGPQGEPLTDRRVPLNLAPAGGGSGLDLWSHTKLEPVGGTDDPPILGRFQWPEPDLVEFVPQEDMPALATITVRLLGGPDGIRGVSGSYLEDSEGFSFLGDYTIHGAPWRTQFGFPQSNGCVSMATDAARRVYDWAPEGTPVEIH